MADVNAPGAYDPLYEPFARIIAPRPDVDECQACGADAETHLYWNPTGGWACRRCGASDYEEAAE